VPFYGHQSVDTGDGPGAGCGFAVHIAFALLLTFQNFMARGEQRYAVAGKSDVSWSSRNMFVLG
jgi:succinate dehydrogenase / fumarate reductase cytochrome b subunit